MSTPPRRWITSLSDLRRGDVVVDQATPFSDLCVQSIATPQDARSTAQGGPAGSPVGIGAPETARVLARHNAVLIEVVEAVLTLHTPVDENGGCYECSEVAPCPTVTAIEHKLEER